MKSGLDAMPLFLLDDLLIDKSRYSLGEPIILNFGFHDALNRSSRRKRGMASNPLFTIPDFFLHFPNELCYGYLRFEGNGKIPLGK